MRNASRAITGLVGAAAGGLGIYVAVGSYITMKQMLGGKRQTYDEAIAWQKEHHDLSWFDERCAVFYTINGFEDYTLHAMFYPCPDPSDRYMILTHGYTDNLWGSMKYVHTYLSLGFNCVLYDLRGHGKNEPHICTYTVLESKDLLAVIRDTRKRYGDDIRIALHGESLGASTTAAVLGLRPDVEFAVCDCGFSNVCDIIRGTLEYRGYPAVMADGASLLSGMLYGYPMSRMRPVDCLTDNHVPILFIHGADDNLIPSWHSQIMHAKTAGYSEFHTVPGARHAKSLETDPANYRRMIVKFLKAIRLMTGDDSLA